MAEINDIVRVAVDAYHGTVTKYSVGESMELLRQAMIDANGGSTKLDYKKIRDGKCGVLFTLIEEILTRTIVEGFQGDEYFNALVDFIFADNILNIIAGDDKPIKCVYEGQSIIILGDPTKNKDLTQDYFYGEKYGMGIVLAGGNSGIGRYEII